MTSDPVLSVLIVAWNVRDLVLACLASIEADAGAPPLEVILVDNASSDGTVDAVVARYPHVRVLANAQNVGFPRANNQALAHARGRYVLYLNPDTEVDPGTLAACVRELEENPDIGLVGCRLESPAGEVQYEGARNTYRFRHLMFELLYLHMLFPHSRVFGHHRMGDWDHRGNRDVEAVNGAFMMVPRDLANRVGGLPEDLFMYHEDLSFCLRILRTGRRLRYLGDVRTVHHWAQSSRKSTARLALLEVECKHRFVCEASGPRWGAAARFVLGVRAVVRMGIATAGTLLPQRWKEPYPRVFDLELHWLQLRWAVRPASIAAQLPRAPETESEPMRLGAWPA
ncbi:MAG TPA: glycosyltransferase family 2 protein [Longimicrobiales bacterium]|nr:glycosyltransferase family 2 protein [Longimicrobiales bacterium]